MDWLDIKEFIKDSFIYILIFIFVLLIVIYLISFSEVVGPSMSNTLNDKDITLVFKANYEIFDVKRGDIVSFKYKDTKYLIKRVIGLPGDQIEYIDGKLYINDILYKEKYIDNNKNKSDLNMLYEIIPDNEYFVLGDNRDNSLDSRKIGFIKKEDIIGKIVFRIFPFNGIKIIK